MVDKGLFHSHFSSWPPVGKESVLGKEHPDTLNSTEWLALILKRQGKYGEAEQYIRRTLMLRESVFGKEHSDISRCMKKTDEDTEVSRQE